MSAVWIDLENTPHVLFFAPIIRALEERGVRVVLTARDFAQTLELASQHGLSPKIIGREQGSNSIRKAIGLGLRTIALLGEIRDQEDIQLAVGHGSRGLVMTASILRIPSLTLYDYEGASVKIFNRLSTLVMTPEIIPFKKLAARGLARKKHRTYPGLKEEVYLQDFRPDNSILMKLGIEPSGILVTIRPPSETAHYRAAESFALFDSIMTLLMSDQRTQIVLLPRTIAQRSTLGKRFKNQKQIVIPTNSIDGPDLLYFSDLVIGGGGTMNREAAVLGVPVASIFKGEVGAVDQWLVETGKMTMVEQAQDIIPLIGKRASQHYPLSVSATKKAIVEEIMSHLRG